jgi:hypothetical protein
MPGEEGDKGKWTGTGQPTTNIASPDQAGGWQDPGQANQEIVEPGSTKAADIKLPAQATWKDTGQSAVEKSPWWPEQ